jgi:hypothetical protein
MPATSTGAGRDVEQVRREVYDIHREMSDLKSRVASLETWRDNQEARHSNTPAWVFGTISAAVAVLSLLLNLWLAGGR